MKKSQVIMVFLTGVFLLVLLGILIGRNITPTYRVVSDAQSETDAAQAVYVDGKININAAGVTDFMKLPGIGEGTARKIIAYREENGPFSATDDLLNVSGIGTKKLEAILPYITVVDSYADFS